MVLTATNDLLLDLPQRPPELGRIRLGEKGPRGAPVSLKTFRLTSASRALLQAAAALYGGTVRPWDDAPDPGYYQLTTTVAELDVLIPTNLRSLSQSLELWQGGTLERRCDGHVEQLSEGPCICAAAGQSGGDRDCELMTRLSVMLPRVPGLGVWRLDTSGWQAATTLPSTITLLAQLAVGQWAHAVLRAEQRSKRERLDGGKVEVHRFVVPVIDLPGMTVSQLVAGPAGIAVDRPALEPGERPAPPTARERAAAARRDLEAGSWSGPFEPTNPDARTRPLDGPGVIATGATAPEPAAAGDGAGAPLPPVPPARPVVTNVGPDQQDQARVIAQEHARAVATATAAERAGAVQVLTGDVVDGMTAGALREWLREHRIAFPFAVAVARQNWGDHVETLDSLDDVQRASLRDDLARA